MPKPQRHPGLTHGAAISASGRKPHTGTGFKLCEGEDGLCLRPRKDLSMVTASQ